MVEAFVNHAVILINRAVTTITVAVGLPFYTAFCCVFIGKLIHSMTAHLEAVTSLAVDPNGLYLLSASEYTVPTTFLPFVMAVKKLSKFCFVASYSFECSVLFSLS